MSFLQRRRGNPSSSYYHDAMSPSVELDERYRFLDSWPRRPGDSDVVRFVECLRTRGVARTY